MVRYPRACRSAETAPQERESWGKPCRRNTGVPSTGPPSCTSKTSPARVKLVMRLVPDRTPFNATILTAAHQKTDPALFSRPRRLLGTPASGGGRLRRVVPAVSRGQVRTGLREDPPATAESRQS